MTPLNLPWSIFGRPIKPVALVLMNTMLVLGLVAVIDLGVLGDSAWSDVLGVIAFAVAGLFAVALIKSSQRLAEYALISSFFVWGFRFWAIILVQGDNAFKSEGFYLSFLWMLLAGGSWLLERADPNDKRFREGHKWTHH